MESGVPLQGKENNGHLDIVFVCAKVRQAEEPQAQDTPEAMGRNLAERVTLVSAEYRALLEAARVQLDTWERPRTPEAAGQSLRKGRGSGTPNGHHSTP